MALEKISLMEAYILETLRNDGVTNNEILQVNESSIEQWSKKHENFDFTLLQKLAYNQSAFTAIIEDGYKVKFLTFNGLVNLLRLKFKKHPEIHFEKFEQSIENLQMNEQEQVILKQLLSPNWTISSTKPGEEISIKQTTRM